MFESAVTNTPVAAGAVVFFVLLFLVVLVRIKRSQSALVRHIRQEQQKLEKDLLKSSKQVLEVRSVVVGLGQKLGEQQDIIQHLNERITELEQVDNDGRLYSRASKMVRLGADVNELIEECELPKAEAELMMSLQNKIAGKEKVPPLESSPESQKHHQPQRGRKR